MEAKLSNRSFRESNSNKESSSSSSFSDKEKVNVESSDDATSPKKAVNHRSFRPKPVFAGFRSHFSSSKNSPRNLSMDPTPSPKVRALGRLSEEGPLSPLHVQHGSSDDFGFSTKAKNDESEALAANRMATAVIDRRQERRRRAEEARNLNHIHEVKIDATNKKVLKPIDYHAKAEETENQDSSMKQEYQVRPQSVKREQDFVPVGQFSSSWEFSSRPEIQKKYAHIMFINTRL